MSENAELSIVIPVLNCANLTKECIESIKYDKPFLLTLVDNGSTDNTYEMMKQIAQDNNIPFEEIDGSEVFLSPEEKIKSEATTIS